MQRGLKSLVVRAMKEIIRKLEKDECELTADEAMNIMNVLSHEALSKDQACEFLNVSRATFDNYIKQGKVKGRKRKGFKELVYYKDELINVFKC